jgi:hypothetical protein
MNPPLRWLRPLALAVLWPVSVPAAAPLPPDALVEQKGEFHVQWLPKAFTSNPTMEMTVFSELTPYGRTLPEVTAAHPVYFVAHDEGYHPMGDIIGEHPPLPSELERSVYAALADRGYLPATDAAHPPGLVLFFFWGSHNALDLDQARLFPELNVKQILERATLVGGRAYTRKLGQEMDFGSSVLDHSAKQDYLRYQAAHDIYYVVLSAYDYAGVARGERKLAWRTTMTVNANGVSMRESLPVLVATGSFYFGRDSGEPLALRRDVHRGAVKLGPLRIIQEDVPLPADSARKK